MEGKIRLAVFGQKRLSREGGIEIVVKELCTRMAQNGCEVTCYNRAGHHVSGAEYDKTIEYDGIRQKVVPTIEKKGLAAVSSSFFAALYSAFGRYDVVHIHAEGPAFFCWIPKLFGKRVICTIHGLDWDREKWRGSVASKFIRGGEKNAVKYADEIIVLSKGVQKYFMDTYGRETHFIPNGVNRPEVREANLIKDHFGLEKDSYILFLGRLVPEKGIRYLVEAFKNVKTDKKLVIAGGSSDTDSFMEELKDLAKGDDRILFTGFVQGAKVYRNTVGDACGMKERYEGVDGLKAYAIIGIALMHILTNGEYGIGGFVFEQLIPSFTNLVFLFMMVSGFGMCCGYYQKFKDQKISVGEFYAKRYSKIWPYFALLCALDFVMSPSKSALYEVFANLTLCQGLLPNMNISVIGVSWTLAVIFVFYLLFPFFCFLLENKKRAWLALACAVIYNFVCSTYFFDESHIADRVLVNFSARTNILYCAVYFIAGGLIFLYRKELSELASKYKVIAGVFLLIATVVYFAIGSSTLTMLFFCVAALVYTIGCNRGGVLVNPVAKFLGGICFEIYLCHMVIYRVLEKLHLVHLFGNGLLAYIFTAVAVICGSVVFSVCAKWFLNKIETFLKERVRRVNHV